MDLPIILIVIVAVGMFKILTGKDSIEKRVQVVQNGGTKVTNEFIPNSAVPIGNNLNLYREVGAYTLIIKELGVK